MSEPGVRVRREGDEVRVDLAGGKLRLPGAELPGPLFDWIDAGRRETYRALAVGAAHGSGTDFFAQHLPVLVTLRRGSAFPFGCANKGVGYLPRPDRLQEFSALYRRAAEGARGKPARETLEARLAAASRFGFDRSAVDPRCLGSLEIFEGETLENLRRHPLAALLFTGHRPTYLSYQVDCAVEILEPGDPRFEFLRLARVLFEYDGFHVAQPRFRFAYVFWVCEARDKTPRRVRVESGGVPGVPWEPGADRILDGVAAERRDDVRREVERYALERGYASVSRELAEEALAAMRLAGP